MATIARYVGAGLLIILLGGGGTLALMAVGFVVICAVASPIWLVMGIDSLVRRRRKARP